MNILKRNQIIVSVIALMLITAGYFSYSDNKMVTTSGEMQNEYSEIGDATLVSTNMSQNINEVANTTENVVISNENTNVTTPSNAQDEVTPTMSSSVATDSDEYFTNSRLKRETMYSQMIESYQKIMNSDNISEDQKLISQNEIQKINSTKNAIMICENLIKTKGFEDLIIFVNDYSISVVVKADELKTEDIAQIQNIVVRELKAESDNIHISTKK